MKKKILRVATRKSKLAIFQAQYVCNELKRYYPYIQTKLVPIITSGDNVIDIIQKKKLKKVRLSKN